MMFFGFVSWDLTMEHGDQIEDGIQSQNLMVYDLMFINCPTAMTTLCKCYLKGHPYLHKKTLPLL